MKVITKNSFNIYMQPVTKVLIMWFRFICSALNVFTMLILQQYLYSNFLGNLIVCFTQNGKNILSAMMKSFSLWPGTLGQDTHQLHLPGAVTRGCALLAGLSLAVEVHWPFDICTCKLLLGACLCDILARVHSASLSCFVSQVTWVAFSLQLPFQDIT